ncbi:50S ribosomal protein L25 [Buchnera aphidicola]|uniref:50S ribosomal protein L25 n=1 Tax=Buchnera aphidicola TaxID=9 RepID=UPI002093328A|nr:50S ribosomal protein L25 [Buchnera aphidicola]USS94227.1 50S ribosomal protein L25 [Buchnera aphidicola (Sipha maydis)]WII23775.1 50S ribosomal protein L25 [Buchnera aphidicola (Sipha maydis)]
MVKIYADIRKNFGTNSSRRLRLKNFFPAIIYGKNKPAILIKLNQNDIMNLFEKNILKKKNLFVVLKKKKIKVVIQEIQRHPIKHKFLHIDFLRI